MEGEAMTCVQCGAPLKSTRGAHRYTESGLSNVTLTNVELRLCASCGEREVVIPRIEELHRVLARAIATESKDLLPEHVRFLRKWLGFSSTDFALVMGVRPETVARWEKKDTTAPISPTAARLLRLMVASQEPATKYPIDFLKLQPKLKLKALKFHAPDWKRAVS
jgi:putative zinc finger/helix-turn-helix YgiT family protein